VTKAHLVFGRQANNNEATESVVPIISTHFLFTLLRPAK